MVYPRQSGAKPLEKGRSKSRLRTGSSPEPAKRSEPPRGGLESMAIAFEGESLSCKLPTRLLIFGTRRENCTD